ncbi:ATPase, T2SS/T4P/T4SS family [Roseovarius sp. SK2]|uniref:CpaF family protein n=1 Tax=Roseovarius TaxID=74030 RepID=UPI00237AA523|nr:ATPase, T2SS/T4P/T4SS family [Roseovarius sp. SK2]MDD9724892.1 ATPase, T2SS/T4P/T4SS family [Roseovarius sp. SK2]
MKHEVIEHHNRAALDRVLHIARHIDANGLSVEEKVNTALTFVVEAAGTPIPLSHQRALLAQAVAELGGDAPSRTAPATQPTAVPRASAHAPADTPANAEAHAPAPPRASDTAPRPAPEPKLPALVESVNAAAASASDISAMAGEMIQALSDVLDFTEVAGLPRPEQESRIHDAIHGLSEQRKMHLNGREVADLVQAVLADMLGLGPLERLLADETVTDIMVNGPDRVYAERRGKLELTATRFRDNAHVHAVASRMVAAVGRRIDEAQPMVDARLKDGSRVNVAIPPLAIDGPTITIRKFPADPMKMETLVANGSLSEQMAGFLGLAAYLRLNVLVSGGTGSGKTTLMNALSAFIPATERLVTIEDAAELRFQQPHVVRFETRPPNVEGKGEVTMRTLVRNALRMRPDRIIIGEIRGDEVLDLLQAMNTGHDGSMSTLHANSPREAMTRIESMAALAGFDMASGVVRRQLADAVQLVIQISRMRDGTRRITSISEVAGLERDVVTLQDLFTFETDPDSTRNEVRGIYRYSGYRPKFAGRAADYGVSADLDAVLRG